MKHTHAFALLTTIAVLALAGCSGAGDEETASSPSPSASAKSQSASPTPDDTASETTDPGADGTAITLTGGGRTFNATLNDSQVSQDFIETLPATLPWYRNSDIEYITELDAPLTETGPFYTDVQPGDLVYYNPMDSITVIYEETSSVPTLTKMGDVTSDLSAFRNLPDDVTLRVELG
jgi:hypothetical protein